MYVYKTILNQYFSHGGGGVAQGGGGIAQLVARLTAVRLSPVQVPTRAKISQLGIQTVAPPKLRLHGG